MNYDIRHVREGENISGEILPANVPLPLGDITQSAENLLSHYLIEKRLPSIDFTEPQSTNVAVGYSASGAVEFFIYAGRDHFSRRDDWDALIDFDLGVLHLHSRVALFTDGAFVAVSSRPLERDDSPFELRQAFHVARSQSL